MRDRSFKIYRIFYPLSWVYGSVVAFRNKLFDWKKLPSKSFDVPIICIGNLSVGGTGKTPHTEYLVELLQKQYSLAVLSRGYKRKTKGYLLADAKSTAAMIGDEPYQICKKYPNVRVAVDENRCNGVDKLLELNHPPVEVILLDDAFQHRYVKAGLNILLTDYNRLFCDDLILPAGRLRESSSGKRRAQIVIVTKCPNDLKPIDYNIIAKRLNLFPYQQLYFSSFHYDTLKAVFPNSLENSKFEELTLSQIKEKDVLLVTGIASPKPLVKLLKENVRNLDVLSFDDHHDFTIQDMRLIKQRFEKLDIKQRIIVTTEKDVTRLQEHPGLDKNLKAYIYMQPIKVKILQNQQNSFNQQIKGYVRENSRNSCIFEVKNAY